MSVNRIAVVDYGMGNLRSVAQAVMHAASGVDHAQVQVTADPQVWLASILDLLNAGHADEARVSLREWRLRFPRSDVPTEVP